MIKQKNKKMEDNKKNYIFSIVVLSVVLCISLVYNFLGGFNFDNYLKFTYEVGDDAVLKLNGIGAESQAFAIDGTSLPGDTIKQKIQVVLPDMDTTNMILRVKIVLNNKYLVISGFNSWEANLDDNYYYFTGEMYKNQTLGVCSEITLNEDLSLKKDCVYFMTFVVEYYFDGLKV